MKTHAKDFLIEFANNSKTISWQKALIYEVVNSNGNINQTKLNEIYESIKSGTSLVLPTLVFPEQTSITNVQLQSLKHISGAFALCENQTINFSDSITILYGLNGSGKSSYFKILHEIVGGILPKDILSNIYATTPQPLNIEIKYKTGTQNKIKNWNKEQGVISDLANIKIFDSSYLNNYLDSHIIDKSVVQPFGISLISYTVDKIDELKQRLLAELRQLQVPNIDTSKFTEDLKQSFLNQIISQDQEKYLQNISQLNEEENNEKINLQSKLSELNDANINSKIQILTSLSSEYTRIIQEITNTSTSLAAIESEINTALENQKKAKLQVEQIKQKIEIINTIPGSDTSEWKNFIISANAYSEKMGNTQICPYCRQSLHEDAQKLLEAYVTFLSDKSQSNLKEANNTIIRLENKIKSISIKFSASSAFDEDLTKKTLKNDTINFYYSIEKQKKSILDNIKNGINNNLCEYKYDKLINLLKEQNQNITSQIKSLQEEKEQKETIKKQLQTSLDKLIERESIFFQHSKIKEWISIQSQKKVLSSKINSINTASISSLTGKAYKELVSQKLIDNFNIIFKSLFNANSFDISLKEVSVNKGNAKTQLILANRHGVHKILSEGEQKAVGLALFLAEIEVQKNQNPIIFDDPVTSLDHKIASNFADLLMKLDNQIILFSHNQFFIDNFVCSKENHICKTIDTACGDNKGKHIKIYNVQSEGKNSKGYLTKYIGINAKECLNHVKSFLTKTPFDKHSEVAAYLRKSIECIIDEKILNHCSPTRFSNKNSRINWDALSKIENHRVIVNKLKIMHSRLSGGDMHNGIEFIENPIDKDEYDQIFAQLNDMLL